MAWARSGCAATSCSVGWWPSSRWDIRRGSRRPTWPGRCGGPLVRAAQPSERRVDLRRDRRGRPHLAGDGVRARAHPSPSSRPRREAHAGASGQDRCPGGGRARRRAQPRHRPPRREARQHPGDREGRRQDLGLRHLENHGGPDAHPVGPDERHPGVLLAAAGARRGADPGGRRVGAGRDAVRRRRGPVAVPRAAQRHRHAHPDRLRDPAAARARRLPLRAPRPDARPDPESRWSMADVAHALRRLAEEHDTSGTREATKIAGPVVAAAGARSRNRNRHRRRPRPSHRLPRRRPRGASAAAAAPRGGGGVGCSPWPYSCWPPSRWAATCSWPTAETTPSRRRTPKLVQRRQPVGRRDGGGASPRRRSPTRSRRTTTRRRPRRPPPRSRPTSRLLSPSRAVGGESSWRSTTASCPATPRAVTRFLSPEYQSSISFEDHEAFWSTIDSVTVEGTRPAGSTQWTSPSSTPRTVAPNARFDASSSSVGATAT